VFLVTTSACNLPVPPTQPATGPGGSQYLHADVATYGPYYAEGSGDPEAYLYYTFEPASPKPDTAPVVLFLHALFAYNPQTYAKLMQQMVMKGYTVVWPMYDAGFQKPDKFANNAMFAWMDALHRLEVYEEEGHVKPARTQDGRLKTAFMGHSTGGYLSAILATRAVYWENEMEIPFLVVMLTPGNFGTSPDEHFEDMDPDTWLIVAIGEEDIAVSREKQVSFWNEISHLHPDRREFLLVQSDPHGFPPLEANHAFPKTSGQEGEEDALDFFGAYKFALGGLNCVFYNVSCDYAFGSGSEQQTYMGEWSDGTEVRRTLWVEDPNSLLE
jgi:hypothetical protein